MKVNTYTLGMDDLFIWPDGTYCHRYELNQYSHMSDDYSVVFFGTREYDEFFERMKY